MNPVSGTHGHRDEFGKKYIGTLTSHKCQDDFSLFSCFFCIFHISYVNHEITFLLNSL